MNAVDPNEEYGHYAEHRDVWPDDPPDDHEGDIETRGYFLAAAPEFLHPDKQGSWPQTWSLGEAIVAVLGMGYTHPGRTVDFDDDAIAKKFDSQRTTHEKMWYRAVRAIHAGTLKAKPEISNGKTCYYVKPVDFVAWAKSEGFKVEEYLEKALLAPVAPRFELQIADCARQLMELHPTIKKKETAERIVRNALLTDDSNFQYDFKGKRRVPLIEVGAWEKFKAKYRHFPRKKDDTDDTGDTDDDLPPTYL